MTPSPHTAFDSADVGWRSLRLHRRSTGADAEDVRLPAIDDQLVDLQLSGARVVESENGGRWAGARLGPGALSTTPRGKPTHLRWRSVGGSARIEQLRLLVPGHTVVRVVEEVWGRDAASAAPLDTLAFDDDVLRGVVRGAYRAAVAGAPDLYAASVAELVTVHLLTFHGAHPAPRAPVVDEPRVRRAIEYLHAHAADAVSLVDLADAVGLSRYHLLRLFTRHTGETPHRYLLGLRVDEASRLLRTSDLPVARIAVRCGFADPSHFTRTFRRVVGVAPSAYRAAARP